MKRISLLISLLVLFPLLVNATSYNTPVGNDIGYNACLNFQDNSVTSSGSGYLGFCKKNYCYTGQWKSYDISDEYLSGSSVDLVRCTNGNKNYYTEVFKNGCDVGACTKTSNYKYCSVIMYYDCTKTSSGEVYVKPTTTTTTTTKPTTTTTTTTTSKRTTKRTTTRTTTTRTTTTTTTTITTTTTKSANNNNYLSSLKLSTGNINFNKETLIYNVEIDENIKNIEVTATPESNLSKVEIKNNTNIKEDTPIEIIVTSENNQTRIYKVYVKYKKEEPKASSNNLLKSLEVENYKLKFSSKVNHYTLKVDKGTTTLKINAIAEDEKAKIQIIGNDKISNKSKINIIVTSEDGNENVYTILVKEKSNTLLQLLIILLAAIIIIFVINIGKKVLPGRKDKDYDYE